MTMDVQIMPPTASLSMSPIGSPAEHAFPAIMTRPLRPPVLDGDRPAFWWNITRPGKLGRRGRTQHGGDMLAQVLPQILRAEALCHQFLEEIDMNRCQQSMRAVCRH